MAAHNIIIHVEFMANLWNIEIDALSIEILLFDEPCHRNCIRQLDEN